MHCVVETYAFEKGAKAAGLSEDEVLRIKVYLSKNPDAGDLIQGTGGARKVRFRAANKGKSGGYRVVTFYAAEDVPVFLLDVFAKGDRIDLSKAERNELRSILSNLADEYRASQRRRVQSMEGRA